MRRAILGLLVSVAFVLGGVQVAASGVHALRMSLTPEGPAMTDFPSGVEEVYVVFEYTDLMSEQVRVVVTNYAGQVLFENTQTYTGSGTAFIAIRLASGPIPDGPYVTTLYFAGDYLSQAVEWTVGGVNSPPTPTPFPEARLEVQPTTLMFHVEQGAEDPPVQRVLVTNHTVPASIWRATADASWLRLSHRIGLTPAFLEIGAHVTGLPGALYEGNVSVTAAGVVGSPQTVTVTLEITLPRGSVTRDLAVDPSGTGWVAAGEPENHLGSGEIRVGLRDGRPHLGAIRIDLSEIPADSDILAAAATLRGLRWEVEGTGDGWVLELVDPAAIEGWESLDYTALTTAPAAARLSPVFAAEDLAPGGTQFWVFDDTGLAVLESFLREGGEALFRLSGPVSGEDVLFVWDAAGELRVNFMPAVPLEATPTLTPAATSTPTVVPTSIPLLPKPRQPVTAATWVPELGGIVVLGLALGAVFWQQLGKRD